MSVDLAVLCAWYFTLSRQKRLTVKLYWTASCLLMVECVQFGWDPCMAGFVAVLCVNDRYSGNHRQSSNL